MYWIDNYKEKVPKDKMRIVTHEILGEFNITGGVDYYDGNILIGGIADGSTSSKGPEYFQVRLTENDDTRFNVSQAGKDGYYNFDGVAGELCALMSIHFGTRFYHISTTYGELTKNSIQGRNTFDFLRVDVPSEYDRYVFRREDTFEGFKDFLDTIEKIPEQHHNVVIKACANYNSALKEIGIDHEMVFVRLVSAIESLSKDFQLTKKDDIIHQFDLDKILSPLEENVRHELEVIFKTRKSRLKFTRFLQQYSKGYFKGGNWRVKRLKIKKEDLEKISKVIYTARSKYLHSGEGMYLSQPDWGGNFDVDPSVGMLVGKRHFSESEKLPNIEFFERLVRHCILARIKELSRNSPSQ